MQTSFLTLAAALALSFGCAPALAAHASSSHPALIQAGDHLGQTPEPNEPPRPAPPRPLPAPKPETPVK
jgi:hypothetical protein